MSQLKKSLIILGAAAAVSGMVASVPHTALAGSHNPCAAKVNPCKANPCKANPCAAKANPCKANPCKANPCAAKANPCKANPCAAKANPCAANPCAAKANPCAANPCAANPCAANPCGAAPAATLTKTQADKLYKAMAKKLRIGYQKSGLRATNYRRWKKYNTVPYPSATHGGRYVNNFGNRRARQYSKYDGERILPVGSILVKDSFIAQAANANPCAAKANPCAANPCKANPCAAKANPCAAKANPCAAKANPCAANPCAAKANPCAAKSGALKAVPGPLFVMEKMAKGWNVASLDWKYTLIMPNGTVVGQTKGKNSASVKFCIECHQAAGKSQLFFLPEEYRAK